MKLAFVYGERMNALTVVVDLYIECGRVVRMIVLVYDQCLLKPGIRINACTKLVEKLIRQVDGSFDKELMRS